MDLSAGDGDGDGETTDVADGCDGDMIECRGYRLTRLGGGRILL